MKIPPGLKSEPQAAVLPAPIQGFSVSYSNLDLKQLSDFDLPKELEGAVGKRKIDFITGRLCASQALAMLDPRRKWPIVSFGTDRLPGWPEGVVGSITHTEGFSSACVALSTDYQSLGIDAEKVMPVEQAEKIEATISFDQERELTQTKGFELAKGLSLIFSAKESLFKCLYPLVKINFGFLDARLLTLDTDQKSFSIELMKDLGDQYEKGQILQGHYIFVNALVVTGIATKSS